jgi:hypothetical protein
MVISVPGAFAKYPVSPSGWLARSTPSQRRPWKGFAASLETGVPMTFGVPANEDSQRALAGTGGGKRDKGHEVARRADQVKAL